MGKPTRPKKSGPKKRSGTSRTKRGGDTTRSEGPQAGPDGWSDLAKQVGNRTFTGLVQRQEGASAQTQDGQNTHVDRDPDSAGSAGAAGAASGAQAPMQALYAESLRLRADARGRRDYSHRKAADGRTAYLAAKGHMAGAALGYSAGFAEVESRLREADGNAETLNAIAGAAKGIAIAVAAAVVIEGVAAYATVVAARSVLQTVSTAFRDSAALGEVAEIGTGAAVGGAGEADRVDFGAIMDAGIHPSFFELDAFRKLNELGETVMTIMQLDTMFTEFSGATEWLAGQASTHAQAEAQGSSTEFAETDAGQLAAAFRVLTAMGDRLDELGGHLAEAGDVFDNITAQTSTQHEYATDPTRAEKDIWWLWLATLSVDTSWAEASVRALEDDPDDPDDDKTLIEGLLGMTLAFTMMNSAGIVDRGPIEDRLEALGFADFGFMTDVADVDRLVARAKVRAAELQARGAQLSGGGGDN